MLRVLWTEVLWNLSDDLGGLITSSPRVDRRLCILQQAARVKLVATHLVTTNVTLCVPTCCMPLGMHLPGIQLPGTQLPGIHLPGRCFYRMKAGSTESGSQPASYALIFCLCFSNPSPHLQQFCQHFVLQIRRHAVISGSEATDLATHILDLNALSTRARARLRPRLRLAMPTSLDRIFASANPSPQPSSSSAPNLKDDPVVKELANGYKRLASGIVLDASGKPCRQCTSGSAWMAMMKRSSTTATGAAASSSFTTIVADSTATQPPSATIQEQPPDVETLGRATWTLLHTLTAAYPPAASPSMQSTTKSFIRTFSELYPCGYCAEDFRDWMKEPGNEVRVTGREEFGDWACRAHNAVNVKLGKAEFDCGLWKRRWGGEE